MVVKLFAVALSSGRARDVVQIRRASLSRLLPIRSTSISVPRMKSPIFAGCCVNGVLKEVSVDSRPSLACSSPQTRRVWRMPSPARVTCLGCECRRILR
jgi:hypothetical protein